MQMALIEIQPVSPTPLVSRASSGMGIYCLNSFLNDAHHSLISTPKAHSESMHRPMSCRTWPCGHNSRWSLLKNDTWCFLIITEAVTLSNLIAIAWLILRHGWGQKGRRTTQTKTVSSTLTFSKTLKTRNWRHSVLCPVTIDEQYHSRWGMLTLYSLLPTSWDWKAELKNPSPLPLKNTTQFSPAEITPKRRNLQHQETLLLVIWRKQYVYLLNLIPGTNLTNFNKSCTKALLKSPCSQS